MIDGMSMRWWWMMGVCWRKGRGVMRQVHCMISGVDVSMFFVVVTWRGISVVVTFVGGTVVMAATDADGMN
jgi:hypothetical protein